MFLDPVSNVNALWILTLVWHGSASMALHLWPLLQKLKICDDSCRDCKSCHCANTCVTSAPGTLLVQASYCLTEYAGPESTQEAHSKCQRAREKSKGLCCCWHCCPCSVDKPLNFFRASKPALSISNKTHLVISLAHTPPPCPISAPSMSLFKLEHLAAWLDYVNLREKGSHM